MALSLDNINKPTVQKAQGAPVPTTALGAQIGGASEQQAKMAGTPAQVASAAKQNLAAPKLPQAQLASQTKSTGMAFSDALRLIDPTKMNANLDEQTKMARLQNEQVAGKLHMDVSDMISQASADVAPSATKDKALTAVADEDITKAMTGLGMDTSDFHGIASMPPEKQQELVNKLMDGGHESLANQLSEDLFNKPLMIKNMLSKFTTSSGMDEAASDKYLSSLASDLGLADLPGGASAVEQLRNMKPEDFVTKLQESIDRDTEEVSSLKETISSPATSVAEKRAAEYGLIRLGASGMRTAAEETKALAKEAYAITTIDFNGQKFSSLDALLKDDNVLAIVSRALDNDPANLEDANAAMHTLEAVGMKDIVSKYGAALKQKADAAKGKIAGIVAGQKEVDKIANLGGVKLQPNVIGSITDNTGPGGLTKLDPRLAKFSEVVNGKDFSAHEQADLANTLNDLAVLGHPEMIKAAATLVDATSIKDMMPNLKLAAGAEKAQHILEGMNENSVDYSKLANLEQYGLISSDAINNFKLCGVSAGDIYANLKGNLNTIDKWKEKDPGMLRFAAEVFKPKPLIPTDAQWTSGAASLIKAVPDQLTDENVEKAFNNMEAFSNASGVSKDAADTVNKALKELKNNYTAGKVQEIQNTFILSPRPSFTASDSEIDAYVNTYNSNFDRIVQSISELGSKPYANKEASANRIKELMALPKPNADKMKAESASLRSQEGTRPNIDESGVANIFNIF